MTRPQLPPSKALAEPTDPGAARPSLAAGLYVVATPIGNLRDITLRALDVLGAADLVLAEDTRVTRKLLSAFGLSARLESCNDHNEAEAVAHASAAIAAGGVVALVSDAGTPLVSDPGFRLVRGIIAEGHRVIPIPGASSALAALSVSGLPSDRFLFAGFPPNKAGARASFFSELAPVRASLIFFETGPRLKDSLTAMAAAFGARDAVVARELTKLFEEVKRAPLDQLAAAYDAAPKGEMVVLVAPPQEGASVVDEAQLDAALRAALQAKSVKEAAGEVAAAFGVSRRDVYQRALLLKGGA
jgi:16S rRNA (cytidine1402-2'-O)-methyltransferase